MTFTITEEGGTDMPWKHVLIIALFCIPLAALYTIVAIRGERRKRAVAACVSDIKYWINAYLEQGKTITRPQLRDAVLTFSHDLDVYKQALEELGIEVDGQILPPDESEEESQ